MTLRSYSIYFIAWILLCILAVCYFQGMRWPSLYGSHLHQLSRLHILTVHVTVGALLLIAAVESFFFFFPALLSEFFSVRARFHHFAHGATLISLLSGLTMEMIEIYPNPLIQRHLYSALLLYVGLVCFSALCFRRTLGRWSCVGAAVFVTIVVYTAHLGGTVQKGLHFFYR